MPFTPRAARAAGRLGRRGGLNRRRIESRVYQTLWTIPVPALAVTRAPCSGNSAAREVGHGGRRPHSFRAVLCDRVRARDTDPRRRCRRPLVVARRAEGRDRRFLVCSSGFERTPDRLGQRPTERAPPPAASKSDRFGQTFYGIPENCRRHPASRAVTFCFIASRLEGLTPSLPWWRANCWSARQR